ncbi:MAG: hypothetical protein CMJ78_18415 [Planctomycetaceae bacterium]|nr:hypothetical protein [Planctomycetaceae bacterium]
MLVAVSVALIAWSWRKWPDIQVDYGQQLYLAWQLSEGQVLYRDIFYNYGPLTPYAMALWFRVFGASLTTMIVTNLLVFASIMSMQYRLLVLLSNRFAAFVATLVSLLVFSFSQYLYGGNYNYVTPYETTLTYGMLFGYASLTCLAELIRLRGQEVNSSRRQTVMLLLCGLSLALCFLTKPETFLAAIAAAVIGIAALTDSGTRWKDQCANVMRYGKPLSLAFLGTLLVSVCLLRLGLSWSESSQGVFRAWSAVWERQPTKMGFYREIMGTDKVADNLLTMIGWTAVYAVIIVWLGAFVWTIRKRNTSMIAAIVATAPIAIYTVFFGDGVVWEEVVRSLPVVLALLAALDLFKLTIAKQTESTEPAAQRRSWLRLAFTTYALAMMLKVVLNVRLSHYGFALAMPATMVAVMGLTAWIPDWFTKRERFGNAFALGVCAVLASIAFIQLRTSNFYYSNKTVSVGDGGDQFWADGRGDFVKMLIGRIKHHVQPDQTLIVLPEGISVNYLTRRANSTPYLNLMPPNMTMLGEANVIAKFERHPPDFVVLMHRDSEEFGAQYFGRDYGRHLFAWLTTHYHSVTLIGAMPLQSEQFGVLLLRRNDLKK